MISGAADLSSLHVLVPVRGFAEGKTRLGESLDPEERLTLNAGLLRHLLDALNRWPACRRVIVVSADEAVLRLARDSGADPLTDTSTGDLNAALVAARDVALARRATAVLILPADLPLVNGAALDTVLDAADAALAAGKGRPLVVAVPSDARTGTNALLLSPPDVIEPSFGIDSLAGHVRAAKRAEASVQLVYQPELSFDLDAPEDLERLEPDVLLRLLRLGAAALAEHDALDLGEELAAAADAS